jgi:hypothetical protein
MFIAERYAALTSLIAPSSPAQISAIRSLKNQWAYAFAFGALVQGRAIGWHIDAIDVFDAHATIPILMIVRSVERMLLSLILSTYFSAWLRQLPPNKRASHNPVTHRTDSPPGFLESGKPPK